MIFCHIDQVRISLKNSKPPGGGTRRKRALGERTFLTEYVGDFAICGMTAKSPTKTLSQQSRFSAPLLSPRLPHVRAYCADSAGQTAASLRSACALRKKQCALCASVPGNAYRSAGCCFSAPLSRWEVLPKLPPPSFPTKGKKGARSASRKGKEKDRRGGLFPVEVCSGKNKSQQMLMQSGVMCCRLMRVITIRKPWIKAALVYCRILRINIIT